MAKLYGDFMAIARTTIFELAEPWAQMEPTILAGAKMRGLNLHVEHLGNIAKNVGMYELKMEIYRQEVKVLSSPEPPAAMVFGITTASAPAPARRPTASPTAPCHPPPQVPPQACLGCCSAWCPWSSLWHFAFQCWDYAVPYLTPPAPVAAQLRSCGFAVEQLVLW